MNVQENCTFERRTQELNTQSILSKNIRKIIDEKGLKQKAIAQECGINEKAFSNMLCNRQEIRTDNLPLISKALGVDISELFKTD